MQYEVDRVNDGAGEPSIAEMTEKAINILKKNPKGYFLLVEGNLIEIGNLVSIDVLIYILHFIFCFCLLFNLPSGFIFGCALLGSFGLFM